MQFSIEAVREVAQLLSQSGLEEISIETTDEGTQPFRLKIRRDTTARRPASPSATSITANSDGVATTVPTEESNEIVSQTIEVHATAVGLFRSAKNPVREGDTVTRKQVLGVVESLKIPNDVLAPAAGRVLSLLVAEGQGVEYGQLLFTLDPIETEGKTS
jgi:biotin carboxyl carrier protein